MPYSPDEFVCLVVRTKASGDQITLKALRPTAEFYGWTEAFEPWKLRVAEGQTRFRLCTRKFGPWAPHVGGKRLTICRVATTTGRPAGKANVFRISSDAANQDLLRIALATKIHWNWMEDMKRRRVSRADWLELASRIPALPNHTPSAA